VGLAAPQAVTDPHAAARPRPGTYGSVRLGQRRRTTRRASHDTRHNGTIPDPRDAQISRLKTENTELKARLAAKDTIIAEFTAFKQVALSCLAAQHDELHRLRNHQPDPPHRDNVRRLRLAAGGGVTGPCS
jgi:hypothetical protein